MEQQRWALEYERFVAQRAQAGELAQREPAREQRRHPRFPLCANIVWTAGDFQFSIVDLSISGVAFDANRAFEAGREIVVRLSDLVSVRARVIGSTAMESTPMFFTGRYRVRCTFEDSVEGLRFLVMVKDLKQLRIDA
jgi:PilZ domain